MNKFFLIMAFVIFQSQNLLAIERGMELISAAEINDSRSAINLIRSNVDINFQDRLIGANALMLFAENGNVELVDLLISLNSNVDSQDNFGDTPIIYATLSDNLDIVANLFEAGADVNHQNSQGSTALMEAIAMNRSDIARYLIENCNADFTLLNNDGNNALSLAIKRNNRYIYDILIAAGAVLPTAIA